MRGNVKVYQKKIVDRRRKRFFFLSLFALLFLGLIFCGLSYLSQIDALAIQNIEITGIQRLDKPSIMTLVSSRLEGNYSFFFSKHNILLYPRVAIENDIEALPLVKSVDIEGVGHHGIALYITERSEVARFCNREEKGDNCLSLDEDGFIFASTTEALASTTSLGVIYRDSASTNESIGSHIMPENDFHTMQFFVRELSTLDIEPTEVLMQPGGYMEIALKKGGKLIINTHDDLSAVLGNLSTVLTDKSTVPNLDVFLANLSYIRLDAGNKVFYKMKTATSSKK